MKALVYRSPGDKTVEDRPKPELQALGDAIVKVVQVPMPRGVIRYARHLGPQFAALICTS
jgi:hypothetical protein